MINTLILYEAENDAAQAIGEALGYIIGNTKTCTVDGAAADVSEYENLVFVVSCDDVSALEEMKAQLAKIKDQPECKKIALIGFGREGNHLNYYAEAVSKILGRALDCSYRIQAEPVNKAGTEHTGVYMSKTVEAASVLWPILKESPADMQRDTLKAEIEAFIMNHNTFALSTACENEPRCSPVEYLYVDGHFYVITEGGKKFKGIVSNGKVSAGIFDGYESMAAVKGLQITGTAELVPLFSDAYQMILGRRKISLESVKKLPINLYLIKITPQKYEFLNAEFKKQGYRTKQIWYAEVRSKG